MFQTEQSCLVHLSVVRCAATPHDFANFGLDRVDARTFTHRGGLSGSAFRILWGTRGLVSGVEQAGGMQASGRIATQTARD